MLLFLSLAFWQLRTMNRCGILLLCSIVSSPGPYCIRKPLIFYSPLRRSFVRCVWRRNLLIVILPVVQLGFFRHHCMIWRLIFSVFAVVWRKSGRVNEFLNWICIVNSVLVDDYDYYIQSGILILVRTCPEVAAYCSSMFPYFWQWKHWLSRTVRFLELIG